MTAVEACFLRENLLNKNATSLYKPSVQAPVYVGARTKPRSNH